MSEKKHIDRLFQEKFKDFEVSPDKSVWENIEKELKSSKKRRLFVMPWWFKIAGAAAVLALLFLAGNFMLNPSDKPQVVGSETEENLHDSNKFLKENQTAEPKVVLRENLGEKMSEEKTAREKQTNESVVYTNSEEKNSTSPTDQKLNGTNISTEKGKNTKTNSLASTVEKQSVENGKNPFLKESPIVKKGNEIAAKTMDSKNENETVLKEKDNSNSFDRSKNNSFKNNPPLAKTEGESNETETLVNENPQDETPKKSLLEVAAEQKENEIFEKEKPELASTNWQVSPFAAPIYYGGFGSQNAIDPSLAHNESESEVTMSYGVNFSYKISDRLKIRSGVGQVSIAYNTHDIAFATAVKPSSFSNVAYSSSVTDNLEIVPLKAVQSQNSELLGRSPFTAGTLHQQIGFIEVPLEIEYALIDKKIGVSIIGGASTLFLNDNSLVINSENGRTNIGEMKNLNEVSFSTNFGLGLDYKISKQFEINLEPTFKYQLNSFSGNDNGFKPYYFGIYTGIGFKF